MYTAIKPASCPSLHIPYLHSSTVKYGTVKSVGHWHNCDTERAGQDWQCQQKTKWTDDKWKRWLMCKMTFGPKGLIREWKKKSMHSLRKTLPPPVPQLKHARCYSSNISSTHTEIYFPFQEGQAMTSAITQNELTKAWIALIKRRKVT